MERLNAGDLAPKTCYYAIVDKDGNRLDAIKVKKGTKLPPTKKKEYCYEY